MKDFPDIPLAVLESDANRKILKEALEGAFKADPVAYYDKYVHSRRGTLDESYDEMDMAVESPAEVAARMDADMRGHG